MDEKWDVSDYHHTDCHTDSHHSGHNHTNQSHTDHHHPLPPSTILCTVECVPITRLSSLSLSSLLRVNYPSLMRTRLFPLTRPRPSLPVPPSVGISDVPSTVPSLPCRVLLFLLDHRLVPSRSVCSQRPRALGCGTRIPGASFSEGRPTAKGATGASPIPLTWRARPFAPLGARRPCCAPTERTTWCPIGTTGFR